VAESVLARQRGWVEKSSFTLRLTSTNASARHEVATAVSLPKLRTKYAITQITKYIAYNNGSCQILCCGKVGPERGLRAFRGEARASPPESAGFFVRIRLN
jgi:hypothetical protein